MISGNFKRDLYIKIFKQELIREFLYIWDVANDRNVVRDDFTKKLLKGISLLADNVPMLSDFSPITSIVDFAYDHLRSKKIEYVARFVDEIDLSRLEIIADIVAKEAAWRYEHFIVERLHDNPTLGIIPFAKTGVSRILEKLIRGQQKRGKSANILINETNLLAGLIEGHSGAMIQGFTNNALTLKREKPGIFKKTNATINAEDVYGRSGFRQFEVIAGQLNDALYVHKKTSALSPHTLFRNTKPNDPKSGYAIMSLASIQRYEYQPQSLASLSEEMQVEIRNSTPTRIKIDLAILSDYLKWNAQNMQKNICQFMAERFGIKNIEMVQCNGNLQSLELKDRNLSYMDLSGSTISGDLTNVNFSYCYLIATQFVNVTVAHKTSFYQSNCAYSSAKNIIFTEVNFNQSNFSYADFSGSKTTACSALGANWYNAKLANVIAEEDIVVAQATQNLHAKTQREKINSQNRFTQQQNAKLNQVYFDFQKTLKPSASELTKIANQMEELIKKTQAQQAFDYYCHNELTTLKTRLDNTADKHSMAALSSQIQEITNVLDLYKSPSMEEITAVLDQRQKLLLEHFQDALIAVQTNQADRFNQLKNEFTRAYDQLAQRLQKVEGRVYNLETWAARAETTLNKLTAELTTNSALKTRLSELEAKIKQLSGSNSQTKLSETIQFIQHELSELKAVMVTYKQQEKITILYATLPKSVLTKAQVEELYETGRKLENSGEHEQAYNKYASAAKEGHIKARTNQAYCLIYGIGTQKNYQHGFDLLQQSAKENHLRAIQNLARLYETGIDDIQPDLNEALYWYKRANAMDKVAELTERFNSRMRIKL